MVPSGLGLTQVKQGYDYNYDNLNRLQVANYTTTGNIGKFNEQVSYDVMGNITALKRTNSTVAGQYLNNFTYDYTSLGVGNKLWGVADAGTAAQGGSYQYDVNGNATIDTRNQITGISYNLLNLPQTVSRTAGNLTYIYDAQGTKLEKVSGGITRDYIGGIEYNNGAIEFIATEEGRAVPTGSTYGYEYYLKDHLGNTRAAVKQDGSIALVQDYYAFGLDMNPGNAFASTPQNQYKYNGKEKQETGYYDYGWRQYDPVIGRWGVIDPFAEKYPSLTPCAYVANSPINLTDIDGRDWEWNWKRDKEGNINGLELVLNGKILDRTRSYSAKQLETLKNDYVKGIQGMLKGSFGKDFSITTTANLSVVSSLSDVKSTDHLINIISNDAMAKSKGGNVNGTGELGGLNVWMTQRSVDETLKTGSAREISHELGHTGGLPHPDEQGQNSLIDMPNSSYDYGPNANNFMWGSQTQLNKYYGMNPMNNSQPEVNFGANSTYVDPNQLWSGIFNNIINHKINQQYGRPAAPPKNNSAQ